LKFTPICLHWWYGKSTYDLQEVNELNRKIYELEQRISELEGEKAEHAKRDLQTLIKA
jgi:hypothetical protein